MSRQRLMKISNCSQVPRASGPCSVTMRALWSRTAPISARWSWMLRSRVTMSQPRRGDLRYPVLVEGCGGDRARRTATLVHDPAGVTGVGDVVADLNQELREAEYVGVDVEP